MFVTHPVGALAPFPAARAEIDARPKFQEFLEIAPLYRQIADELIADGAAQHRVRRFYQGQRFGDRDLLGLLAGL